MSTITHTAALSWAAAHRLLAIVLVAVAAAALVAATMVLLGGSQDGTDPIRRTYAPAAEADPCANTVPGRALAC